MKGHNNSTIQFGKTVTKYHFSFVFLSMLELRYMVKMGFVKEDFLKLDANSVVNLPPFPNKLIFLHSLTRF